MKTLFFGCGIRVHWQTPTAYRIRYGIEMNPRSTVLYIGWLVLEQEWYDCAMTCGRKIVQRDHGITI